MVVYKEIRGTVMGKGKLDVFIPKTTVSNKWKHWKAVLDLKTCEPCRNRHGKTYPTTSQFTMEYFHYSTAAGKCRPKS